MLLEVACLPEADFPEIRDAGGFDVVVEVVQCFVDMVAAACPGLHMAALGGYIRWFIARALIPGELARDGLRSNQVMDRGPDTLAILFLASVPSQTIQ